MLILLIIAGAIWSLPASREGCGQDPSALEQRKLPSGARVGVSPSQALRALTPIAPRGDAKLQANAEISRGPGAAIYPKVAPATVLIETPGGTGTGFLISDDGWIVTNAHVVNNAQIHIGSGIRLVKVYLGHLNGRIMEIDQPAMVAAVFKTSEEKDLALLKLAALPKGVKKLPSIPFAKEPPGPGSDCVVIGHPKAGMLWTVRSGEISGIGQWPRDQLRMVHARLSASKEDAEQLKKILAAAPARKILISSCGINPGDSGGPVVDVDGNLIGVTFGIPRSDPKEGIHLDKFSYHIHLDELKVFLKDRPARPIPFVPDPWPRGTLCELTDQSKDKIFDTLIFGTARNKSPTGYLFDLDQDTTVDFDRNKLSDPKMRAAWDFEFGMQFVPQGRTFYDTDNDGKIDTILTDINGDKNADMTLKLLDGRWKAVPPAKGLLIRKVQPMFDPSLFKDKKIAEQFAKILGPSSKGPPEPKPAPPSKRKSGAAETPESVPPPPPPVR